MARRVAINLTQRTVQAGRGRGSGRGRGRGRGIEHGSGNNIDEKGKNREHVQMKKRELQQNHDNTDTETTQILKPTTSQNKLETKIRTDLKKEEIQVIGTMKISEKNMKEPIIGRKRNINEITNSENDSFEENSIIGIMGFTEFNTTKNKHVKGTDCYGINFRQKTEYRQYINREGGSNRTLSPTRGDRKKKIKMSLKK
jgi:U4/U6.U5 tri-snRNP-associated protein 3